MHRSSLIVSFGGHLLGDFFSISIKVKNQYKENKHMKSIFVGNLPWSATDEELKQKFSEFGTVISARIMMDKMTNKSRGFGFVDMEDADMEKAIAGMSGKKWGDRELTVNEAKPRENRTGGSGGRREFRSSF
jgi:RNA recognition motif-containing protein